ncbi:hypothetical protein Echvi_1843 [Echinicola vietnamensis DSM 17526]|uniref:Uncharacterized protein n=1 Tax=Echinicola vietnamensis (strain DSM 17526 / LMG 23754 / KMM 6221) TaxID=926556 RepID=L0FXT8_ECHVK|nr:hypothetical protein Echvi_1843 [Echinicola vietnamensis DSM 17526]
MNLECKIHSFMVFFKYFVSFLLQSSLKACLLGLNGAPAHVYSRKIAPDLNFKLGPLLLGLATFDDLLYKSHASYAVFCSWKIQPFFFWCLVVELGQ